MGIPKNLRIFFLNFYPLRLFKSAGRKNSVEKHYIFSEANKMKCYAHILRAHPKEKTVKPNCDICDSSHKNVTGLKEHRNINHKDESSYKVEAGMEVEQTAL